MNHSDNLVNSHSPLSSKLNKLAVVALFAFIVVVSFQQIFSPDIGFHLKGGQWILENGRFPSTDQFTYTSSSHEYIDLHWIYQITFYTASKFFGEFGIAILNTILLLFSFLIMLIRCTRRRPLDQLSSWQILFFLAIWTVSFLFEARPQVLSWVYLNLLLLILEDYYDGRSNYLILLPLLMLLWTNSHSIFIMGWIIIACYLVGICWREKKLWTPLTPIAIVSIGISFLNPYFARGIALPFQQFAFLQTGNVFKESIAEYASPMQLDSYIVNGHFTLFQPLFPFHVFLVVAVIALLIRLRRIALHEIMLILFSGYLAITGIRNIGSFVFIAFPSMLLWLQHSGKTAEGASPSNAASEFLRRGAELWSSVKLQTMWNVVTILGSAFLILTFINGSYYINFRSNNRFGFHYNALTLPVEASSFLTENKLDGKILNDFNFGGFLINAIPQKVYIDGRNEVTGEQLYSEYGRYWRGVDKQPLIEKYEPEIIIFAYQDGFLWVHFLKNDSSWRLVHVDPVAAVYLKSGYAANIPPVDSMFYSDEYRKFADSEMDSLLTRSYPSSGFFLSLRPLYFPLRELDLSTFCYYNDWFDAAIQIGLNGLEKSTVACPEMYYNLGHYFFEKKDFRRSALCYQRYLQTNFDGLAQFRVKNILAGHPEGNK
jgi:hypothetical protein